MMPLTPWNLIHIDTCWLIDLRHQMSMAQRPRMAQDGSGARSILHIETGEARLSLRLCLTRFESNTDENLLPSQDRPGICLLHQISPGTSQDMPNIAKSKLSKWHSNIKRWANGKKRNEGSGSSGKSQRSFGLHVMLVTWNLSLTLALWDFQRANVAPWKPSTR